MSNTRGQRTPRAAHPTGVTYVPCPKCGQKRPIHYQTPASIRRAEQRPCHNCNPGGSHTPRPGNNDWQSEVDEVAVQRLLSGSRVRSTRAERQAAVAYLDGRLPAPVIAERIGASQRTVERLRQRIREAG